MASLNRVSSGKVKLIVVKDNATDFEELLDGFARPTKKKCALFGKIGLALMLLLVLVQSGIILYFVINYQPADAMIQPQTSFESAPRFLDQFNRFVKKYGKVYANNDEFMRHFQNYVQNMIKIDHMNQFTHQYSTFYGENEFTDWSDEEFRRILLPVGSFKNMRERATFISSSIDQRKLTKWDVHEEIPEHFDWRPYKVVTPVKSQFKCGSCWAFATVGTVESAYAIGTGELRNLSEQQLLDCNLDNNACDGGDVDKALRYVYDEGLVTEYDYPYVAHRQDQCALHGTKAYIKSAVFLHQDEASIIDWLIHYGPVNVGINVTGDMKAYKGGVYTPKKWECENKIIGTHALNIVGYGTWKETNEKYWIVKNSWGQNYGIENGYVYFARGINSCGIEDEPVGVLA